MTQPHLDAQWMRHALELAARGPQADPNPRVGCVIVAARDHSGRDGAGSRGAGGSGSGGAGPDPGQVVGEGFHAGAGTLHAEVVALSAAGERARGATAYVSLEPCDHTGRTGPCSRALVEAGVARVVYAQGDPDPAAAGGADRLRAAGVDVTGGVLAPEAEELNRAWTLAATLGRPMVTWKLAATLDGRSAAADGSSRWITAAAAREDVHRRRAGCGAVLVGTGTALADDPALTARRPDGALEARQPLRVVMGRRALPSEARVLDGAAPTLVLATRDPAQALAELHARDVRHVWLEGGPTLAAAFLRAGLVDEVVAYLAPAFLGAGPAAVGDLGIAGIDGIRRLQLREVAAVGPDVRIVATPLHDPAATGGPPAPVRQPATPPLSTGTEGP